MRPFGVRRHRIVAADGHPPLSDGFIALAGSQALQADALDFLADATTYGISLTVIGASIQTRARAAIAKALSLTVMALWVLGSTAYHVLVIGIPRAEVMGAIGILALAAN